MVVSMKINQQKLKVPLGFIQCLERKIMGIQIYRYTYKWNILIGIHKMQDCCALHSKRWDNSPEEKEGGREGGSEGGKDKTESQTHRQRMRVKRDLPGCKTHHRSLDGLLQILRWSSQWNFSHHRLDLLQLKTQCCLIQNLVLLLQGSIYFSIFYLRLNFYIFSHFL